MGRFRSRQPSERPGEGESCSLCGVRVPVGPDGRCRLGHRVREAGAAPPTPLPGEVHADAPAVQEDLAEAPQGPVAVHTDLDAAAEPAAPAPMQTGLGQTDLDAVPQPEPSSAPPAVAPPALQDTSPTADAAAWHPYDEVLVPGPSTPGPGGAPASAPAAPTADESRSPLEDLLSWDEPMQSALDVSVDALPAPAAAADIDAADPAPAPDEVSVADDEASGTEQTAHQRLGMLLGSGALALLALAAFAVAAML